MRFGRPPVIWIMTATAVVFGLLTIKSGGSVLFIDGVDRQLAGNYVPFILWFNFIAGFFYLIAAVGLWQQKQWAVLMSSTIAIATLAIFLVFSLYIFMDGLFETRTVAAMILRSTIWTLIAVFSYRKIYRQ